MNSILFLSIISLSLILVIFPQADAAVDMFLKIEGVEGEAQDDKHKNEIEILSWHWGLSQSGSFHVGGGGGAGKANFQDLSVTKWIDSSSTTLMLYAANGDHFSEGTLTIRKAAKTPFEFEVITMKKILVTSISLGGSSGEDRLTEQVTFNFAEVKVEQKSDSSSSTPGIFNWNIQKNTGEGSVGGDGDDPLDADGDGIPDTADNCPTVHNSSQANFDGDSLGDACDSDDDNDGIPDGVDPEPKNASNDTFDDGTTSGSIFRGDQIISISFTTDNALLVTAASRGGGLTPATVTTCGGDTVEEIGPGDSIKIQCGSISVEVLSGTVTVQLNSASKPTTVVMGEGSSMTFDEDVLLITAGDDGATVNVGGQTQTIGNNETIEVGIEGTLAEDIQALINDVNSQVDARAARSLTWLLNSALTSENGGDTAAAISKLESFNSRLGLFTARGMIDPSISEPLSTTTADMILKGKKILQN